MVKDDTSIKIKQELEESRKNEALLASLLENSCQPFGVGYSDGSLGLVNKAFEKLTGYTRDELKSTDWSKILTPHKFRDMENEKLKELQRTGQPVRYEKEYIKKDGTRVPIELLVHIVKKEDGTPEYYYSFITDISERKKAEKLKQELLEKEQQLTEELKVSNEALNESEEKFSKAFHSNSAAMTITRMSDGMIIDANESFETLFGHSHEETVGHSTNELGIWLTPQERDAEVEQLLKLGKLPFHEVIFGTKSGENIYVLFSVELIHIKGQKYILTTSMDFTEHKKAEERNQKLLESEQQLTEELQTSTEELQFTTEELYKSNEDLKRYSKLLSTIYELNPDAIVLTTVNDSKIIDCNQEYLNQIGYTREEVIGHTSQELNLISEITREAYIDETRGKEIVSNFEGKIRQKSGSIIDVMYSTRQITIDNEPIILNIGHNITEIKKAEKQMEFDSLILNQVNDAVLGVDNNFNITYWNKGAEKMFGYTQKEALGTNTVELIRPKYVPGEREKKLEELEKKRALKTTMYAKHKNGTEIIVDQNVSQVVDDSGLQTGYVVVDRDITENKHAEFALRESEEKYRNIIETANEGIMITDPSAIIIFANAKMLEMLGYSIEELVGRDSFSLIDRSEFERAKQRVENRKKGISGEYDLKFRTKNGEELWTHGSVSPLHDHNGVHTSNLTMYTDISKRKKAEKEIQKTLDELKRSNQELERFAYVSSHDLQEPLRMVTLYSQLLERRYKDSLDQDADDFIEYIVENAKRMKQLIDDLLDYSRVTSQAKEFENVDLEKVLDLVLTNLSMNIAENNVEVTHESLPTVFADENQMLQVFQNLIINAIKFQGEKPPEINISANKGENEWTFCVSDNGIGIRPEHQKQIFEVFKRLHTRDEYPGTGIGLSIVQKIVHQQGGQIWVESEPGKGSTFYFTIPQ